MQKIGILQQKRTLTLNLKPTQMNISYLENIATAKKSLVLWFSNIEQMAKGIQIFSTENTLRKEDTLFGKWYEGEGQTFNSFETFRAIEEPYHILHSKYIAYIDLYKQPIKKSFFSKHKDKRKKELSLLFEEIRDSKDLLISTVSNFEKTLQQSLLFNQKEEIIKTNTEIETKKKTITNNKAAIPKKENLPFIDSLKKQEKTKYIEDNTQENMNLNQNNPTKNKSTDIDIEEEIRRILS